MRVVNPSFGHPAASAEQMTGRDVNWTEDPIALFSNHKPNARELLEGVRARLSARRRVDNVDFLHKYSASQPAPPEMIEAIARKYRIAVLALGD
jgi:hypothetical protein